MQLDPAFIEAACFLGVEEEGKGITPKATAFYVVVPFEHDRAQGRGYLVTARHNIEFAQGRQLYVSINKGVLGGDRIAEWLPILTERWFTDEIESTDVAIADWRPSDEHALSYRGILTDNFVDGPPDGVVPFPIAEGLETATVGLFSYHAGAMRHTPIVRIGNVAAKPVDPIFTRRGPISGYLIEARSVGGLSGSPVFVGENIFQGRKRQPLLGLIHGHYDWKEEFSSATPNTIHTGIAVVTASSAILRILKAPDCVATRQSYPCIF
ncbi:hypothetical protein J2W40_001962 [Sphingobium xenophagum]|uniref:Serine protease n=1 Tax=Sphingobium xenophagum TaxID=121428 RepID=A0ABU1X0N5_SPHXE|nr:hypothetical protein [Sphingobium xenophagum]MDR7155140.1 hypothetical protein [Sphingobium xenophagum]